MTDTAFSSRFMEAPNEPRLDATVSMAASTSASISVAVAAPMSTAIVDPVPVIPLAIARLVIVLMQEQNV